jgi:hypothetical protein
VDGVWATGFVCGTVAFAGTEYDGVGRLGEYRAVDANFVAKALTLYDCELLVFIPIVCRISWRIASSCSRRSAIVSSETDAMAAKNVGQVSSFAGSDRHIDKGRFCLTMVTRWPSVFLSSSMMDRISSVHTTCAYTRSPSLSIIAPTSASSSLVCLNFPINSSRDVTIAAGSGHRVEKTW